MVSVHIGFMNRIMAFAFIKELKMPEGVRSYPLSLECKSDLKHLLLQSTCCFSYEQKVLLRYLKPAQCNRGGAACKSVCLFFHFGCDFMCESYQVCQKHQIFLMYHLKKDIYLPISIAIFFWHYFSWFNGIDF